MRPDEVMYPYEAGAALGVHPRTVIRWAAEGRLTDERTQGGHHRFRRGEVLELVRQRGNAGSRKISQAVATLISRCLAEGVTRDQAHLLLDGWWQGVSSHDARS